MNRILRLAENQKCYQCMHNGGCTERGEREKEGGGTFK